MVEKQNINKMEILTKRDEISTQGSIDVTTLSDIIATILWDKIIGFIDNKMDSKLQNLPERTITRKEVEELMTNSGIFNIAQPINISAGNSVEIISNPIGTFYYDSVKDKLRIRTKHGFKSIKLED